VLDEVGAPDLDDGDIARMQQVIIDTGALDALEAQIATLTDAAIEAIELAHITPESRNELIALANYVSWRAL
jgi:geranylgeranyl diphosphate synthase type I